MINSSFINIPQIQDQDIVTIKNPLPLNDAFRLYHDMQNQAQSLEQRAVRNFELYSKLPHGSASLDQVKATTAGIEGFANWNPNSVFDVQ